MGCSKCKVQKYDKFRRDLSQHKNTFKSKMRYDQVFEGVSVLYLCIAFLVNIEIKIHITIYIQRESKSHSKYNNAKCSIPAHLTFVNDTCTHRGLPL